MGVGLPHACQLGLQPESMPVRPPGWPTGVDRRLAGPLSPSRATTTATSTTTPHTPHHRRATSVAEATTTGASQHRHRHSSAQWCLCEARRRPEWAASRAYECGERRDGKAGVECVLGELCGCSLCGRDGIAAVSSRSLSDTLNGPAVRVWVGSVCRQPQWRPGGHQLQLRRGHLDTPPVGPHRLAAARLHPYRRTSVAISTRPARLNV
mmetsp:Transcript_32963/g.95124  ORF Transcript_32963/g.95124 Transcript_32963/m.95124 type:complete len:209 (+) Transcript_32963:2159-2785(+)